MDQVKFVEDSLNSIPQILFGPFLNTLSHLMFRQQKVIK